MPEEILFAPLDGLDNHYREPGEHGFQFLLVVHGIPFPI
jgi:hypothetical protein